MELILILTIGAAVMCFLGFSLYDGDSEYVWAGFFMGTLILIIVIILIIWKMCN